MILDQAYNSLFEIEDKLEELKLKKNALDNDKIKLDKETAF